MAQGDSAGRSDQAQERYIIPVGLKVWASFEMLHCLAKRLPGLNLQIENLKLKYSV